MQWMHGDQRQGRREVDGVGEVGTQERSGGWERDREEGGRRTHWEKGERSEKYDGSSELVRERGIKGRRRANARDEGKQTAVERDNSTTNVGVISLDSGLVNVCQLPRRSSTSGLWDFFFFIWVLVLLLVSIAGFMESPGLAYLSLVNTSTDNDAVSMAILLYVIKTVQWQILIL